MTTKLWKMNLICDKYNLDNRKFNLILDALINPKNDAIVKKLEEEEIKHLVPLIVKDISDCGALDLD
tara:strand:+ start:391 stop:591 length:201 start_codon:yes stop_codon:yes gene_type:complete